MDSSTVVYVAHIREITNTFTSMVSRDCLGDPGVDRRALLRSALGK